MVKISLENAVAHQGKPGIDRGSQFTNFTFRQHIERVGHPHLGGRPWLLDGQSSIERLWRSPKYECAFLDSFDIEKRGTNRLRISDQLR
jgi:transposase InsO family protein